MLFPSTQIFATSLAILAVLMAANWLIWTLPYVNAFRLPNRATLRGNETSGTDETVAGADHGFKHVA